MVSLSNSVYLINPPMDVAGMERRFGGRWGWMRTLWCRTKEKKSTEGKEAKSVIAKKEKGGWSERWVEAANFVLPSGYLLLLLDTSWTWVEYQTQLPNVVLRNG